MKRKREKQEEKKRKKKHPLRHIKWGAFIPTLFMGALGVLLVSTTEERLPSLAVTVAIMLAITGALLSAGAFMSKKAEFIQLAVGVIMIALAVWLFVDKAEAASALTAVFAGILILRAVFGMWGSLPEKRTGGNWWKIQLTGAVMIAIFGIILLFNQFESLPLMLILVGVFMLFDAALELMSMLRGFIKGRKKEPKETTKNEPY